METLFYRIFWIDSDYFIARYYFLIIALFTFFCLLVCMSNVKTPLDSHFLKLTGEAILLQQHLMDGTQYLCEVFKALFAILAVCGETIRFFAFSNWLPELTTIGSSLKTSIPVPKIPPYINTSDRTFLSAISPQGQFMIIIFF